MQVKGRWRSTCKCTEQSLVWTDVNVIDLALLKLAALDWVFKSSWSGWQQLKQCSPQHGLRSLGCLLFHVQNLSATCECRGNAGLAWLSSSSNADSQSLSVGVIGEHQEYVFDIDCVLHFLHIKGYSRCRPLGKTVKTFLRAAVLTLVDLEDQCCWLLMLSHRKRGVERVIGLLPDLTHSFFTWEVAVYNSTLIACDFGISGDARMCRLWDC